MSFGTVRKARTANKGHICSAPECDVDAKRGGYCGTHYERMRTKGSLAAALNHGIGATKEERFWSRVDKTPGLGPTGDCWEWRGTGKNGYGYIRYKGRNWRTHRLAWLLLKGHAPGMLLHSCDNRACCNVAHLREGDHKDNAADMVSRGRANFQQQVQKEKPKFDQFLVTI